MQKVEIDRDNFIGYRMTPWDTKVFGFNTNELLEFRYKDPALLTKLLAMLDDDNRANNIKFSYTRIDANDRILKKKLQDAGFYYAETSFRLKKLDLQSTVIPLTGRQAGLALETPGEDDFVQITDFAKNDFYHGRFHEDPNIEISLAKSRFANIIDDQKKLGREFLVYKKNRKVLAFHIFSIAGDECDLILSGTTREGAMISYYFWAAVLQYLKKKGVRQAFTIISAANVPIVNLYSYFDFKLEKTLIGFHKLYKGEVHG